MYVCLCIGYICLCMYSCTHACVFMYVYVAACFRSLFLILRRARPFRGHAVAMDSRKVFIGKFAWSCTKQMLSQRLLAEGCSGVAEMHIVRKGVWTPGKYCCAFVLFEDADQAAKMLEFSGSIWPEVFFCLRSLFFS